MIIPLITPNVNWDLWLSRSRLLLDRSLTESLDEFGRFTKSINDYLITLDEFIAPGAPNDNNNNNNNELLQHLFYSFLIVDEEKVIMRLIGISSTLSISFSFTNIPNTTKLGVIVSGSLLSLKSLIEVAESDRMLLEVRKITFELQTILINQGLRNIFRGGNSNNPRLLK